MTEFSRREAMTAAAMVSIAAAMPAWAQDAAPGAMWDLTDLYPSDAAWDDARNAATDEQLFLQYIYSLGAHGAHKF